MSTSLRAHMDLSWFMLAEPPRLRNLKAAGKILKPAGKLATTLSGAMENQTIQEVTNIHCQSISATESSALTINRQH